MSYNGKGRRFWTNLDVIRWISDSVHLDDSETPEQAAIWWCCYRETETLVTSETIKSIARQLMDGWLAYDIDSVTFFVRGWTSPEGNEPDEANAAMIDADIERNLRDFFQVAEGRKVAG